MVGPLMLLKLLHCKRKCQKQKIRLTRQNSAENTTNSYDDITNDLSKPEIKGNQTKNVCRVCLKEGDIPIFGIDGTGDISEELNLFGALDAHIDDPHPKNICQSCHSLLLGAILFRKTAQQSDQLLKQPPQDPIIIDEDEIPTDIVGDNIFEFEEEKGIELKSYQCKRCDMNFEDFTKYNEHRLSQEHENMRRTCPICNNTYTALYYKKHLSLHKLESTYMCDICGKIFVVQGQFTRHRLTHFYHLPFKCALCPYKGRFSESLKMHMRTHTGEKPYQCTQCPSRFVNKSNLNKHARTHKSERDFKCDLCSRGFYTKRSLELHFKVDHTGVKDHVCNVCGKAFGYRKQMTKHQLKVHKREKLRSGRLPLYLQLEIKQRKEGILTES